MIRTRVALIEITEVFISCSVTVLLISEALLAAISGPRQYVEGKQSPKKLQKVNFQDLLESTNL